MRNVKLIRMSSGEDLIVTVNGENEQSIQLEDPIVAIPTGNGQLGFAPWSPLVSKDAKELSVDKKFIVYIADPDDEIVKQYNSMFNKVITPSKKIIT